MRHIPQPAVDTVQKIKPHPEAASLVDSVGFLCRQPFRYMTWNFCVFLQLSQVKPGESEFKIKFFSQRHGAKSIQIHNSELLNFKRKNHSIWHTQIFASKTKKHERGPSTSDILNLWVPKIWNHEGAPIVPLLKVCHWSILKLLPGPFTFACMQRLGAKFPDFDWSATKQGINRFHHLLDRLKVVWHGHGMFIDFWYFWANGHCKSWKPLSTLVCRCLTGRLYGDAPQLQCTDQIICMRLAIAGRVLASHLRFWKYVMLLCTSDSWPCWQNDAKSILAYSCPFLSSSQSRPDSRGFAGQEILILWPPRNWWAAWSSYQICESAISPCAWIEVIAWHCFTTWLN